MIVHFWQAIPWLRLATYELRVKIAQELLQTPEFGNGKKREELDNGGSYINKNELTTHENKVKMKISEN